MISCLGCHRPLFTVCLKDPCEEQRRIHVGSTEKWTAESPKPRDVCDVTGCDEPHVWSPDGQPGSRVTYLCQGHADEWLRGERELMAEREEMAGRQEAPLAYSSLFGLQRELEAWNRKSRRSA